MNGTVTNWMTTSDCLIWSTQQSGILDDYNLTMNYHDDAQLPLRDNIFLHALPNNDVMHIYMISDILFIALRVLCLLKKAVPVRTYSVNYPMYNARYLQFSGRKRSLNILLSSTKTIIPIQCRTIYIKSPKVTNSTNPEPSHTSTAIFRLVIGQANCGSGCL
jgi:hypothetical protein